MAGKASKKTAKVTKKAPAKVTKKAPAKRATVKKPAKPAGKPSGSPNAAAKIDRMIEGLGDWRGERIAEIRRCIHEVDPQVIEDWKWMGTPVWSHDGMYALANPHKGKVKLTFLHGAKLSDPKKLLNTGTGGNTWRAIDIFEGDKLDRTALKALLRAAIDYNKKHAVPKSRGSRV